jgi:hypothetical protein
MSRTVTVDTSEWLFVDENGVKSYLANGSVFTIVPAGSGTPRSYTITSVAPISLADGRKIRFDNTLTSFQADSDAGATSNAGSIWIEEDNGYKAEWKIRTVTIDNVATPTAITTMVMERVDNPMITCSLSGITVGA